MKRLVRKEQMVFVLISGLTLLLALAACESKDTMFEKKLVGKWHILNPQPPLLLVVATYHPDGTYVMNSKYEEVRLLGLMNAIKDGSVSGTYCVRDGHLVTIVNESSVNAFKKGLTSSEQILELTDNKLVVQHQGGQTEKYERES